MKKPIPFGKYFLLERINVGGMAEVFRAKAYGVEGFERLVAVKRILPNIAEDKEFIRMFIEEAKLAVQLNHANIAQIFDLGVVDGSYYIALEHVHGRDVRGIFDRCRQVGEAMPVAQACFVVMKVCEGLDYAHNKRDQSGRELHLVHRDVSPQNMLVSFEGEVKLIDFGIAKAAGKGSKTQAGILKGKFGYMSPEQVRGLPIDRRSDVFSCGIVLYELLTGERLFVGESDFSTLEKVRNVEILPPSTYNRKIPDELERIVLKALAKDVDDRYQNAIDLHDELQAFVYTAGEFYSRKDLAGWMRKTFGKEIDEESAKLESFRQLKPPAELTEPLPVAAAATPMGPSGGARPPAAPPAPFKRTAAMPAVPPPVPGQAGGGVARPPPPPGGGLRSTQGVGVVPPAASAAALAASAAVAAASGASSSAAVAIPVIDHKADLNWDDDELETQIHDNAEEEAAARTRKQAAAAAGSAADDIEIAVTAPEPDRSALIGASAGWPPPGAIGPGRAATSGANGAAPTNGARSQPTPPGGIATGTGRAVMPLALDPRGPMMSSGPMAPMPGPPGSSMRFDTSSSFGSGLIAQRPRSRAMLWAGLGGAALIGGAIVVVLVMSGGGEKTAAAPSVPGPGSAAVPTATGVGSLEIVVSPAGIASWRLDGNHQDTRFPVNIKDLAAGKHQIAIDAPPGFMSTTEDVEVTANEIRKLRIDLAPLDVVAAFESTPPGARVAVLVGGKRIDAGITPTTYKIDPRERYEVVFEKDGYVSVTRPLALTGAAEEKVAVALERAAVAVIDHDGPDGPATTPDRTPGGVVHTPGGVVHTPGGTGDKPPGGTGDKPPGGTGDKPPGGTGDKPPGGTIDRPPPVAKGEGVLSLGAKPPCEIFVDGRNTGLRTPQREMKLSAGKHKITLLNNEFGIKESFNVDIKVDEPTKMVKDYSARIPQ